MEYVAFNIRFFLRTRASNLGQTRAHRGRRGGIGFGWTDGITDRGAGTR